MVASFKMHTVGFVSMYYHNLVQFSYVYYRNRRNLLLQIKPMLASLKLSQREIWFIWHWLMAPDWNIFAFLEKCVGFFQCLMVFVRTRHPTLQSIKCLRVIKLSRALKAFDFWNSWSFVNQYFSHSTFVELIGRSAWRIMQHFLYCKYYYVG